MPTLRGRCGPDGHGYKLELPKQWLLDNRKYIAAGARVVKLAAAAGRLSGLPILSMSGLPTQVVSQAEVQAVRQFESLLGESHDLDAEIDPFAASTANDKKGQKADKLKAAATSAAYKALRRLLKEQCKDEDLQYTALKKVRVTYLDSKPPTSCF